MDRSPLRVGLVGTGFGAKVHLPQWQAIPGVEVRMVCSARGDRAGEVARSHGVPSATDDYRELIACEEVDLVDVATHADRHHEIASAALAAGKHVLCEKPLALSIAQARDLVDAAAAAGTVAALCHQHRYLAPRGRFRRLVSDGYLGEPRYVGVTATSRRALDPSTPLGFWGPYFQCDHGGGVLNQILPHYIDFLISVFGELRDPGGIAATMVREKPVALHPVRTGSELGPVETDGMRAVDADDTAVIHARLDNGAPVSLVGSWVTDLGSASRIEAHGSEGTLVLDGATLRGGRAGEELTAIGGEEPADADAEAADLPGAFAVLARAVAAAARGDDDPPTYPTFADGLRVQTVVDAVQAGRTA